MQPHGTANMKAESCKKHENTFFESHTFFLDENQISDFSLSLIFFKGQFLKHKVCFLFSLLHIFNFMKKKFFPLHNLLIFLFNRFECPPLLPQRFAQIV